MKYKSVFPTVGNFLLTVRKTKIKFLEKKELKKNIKKYLKYKSVFLTVGDF